MQILDRHININKNIKIKPPPPIFTCIVYMLINLIQFYYYIILLGLLLLLSIQSKLKAFFLHFKTAFNDKCHFTFVKET